MIYQGFDLLPEVIESFYVTSGLSPRIGECDTVVNPRNIKYLYGKTIIINRAGLDPEFIRPLAEHNKIIYRIKEDIMFGDFSPYLDCYVPGIVWSGYMIPEVSEVSLEDHYSWSDSFLSFPKVLNPNLPELMDSEGHLTYLGFLLYQTGSINFPGGSVFKDLDIAKTGKVFV